jgi:PAS domain S-box-containing protein
MTTLVVSLVGLAPKELDSLLVYRIAFGTLGATIVLFVINRFWSGGVAILLTLALLTAGAALGDEAYHVVQGRSTFLFAIPILMASVLLRPWASFAIAGLSNLLILFIATTELRVFPPLPPMIGFFAIALLAWFSARSLERVLQDLRTINEELDHRVSARTRELAEALAREHAEANQSQAVLQGIADGVIVFDNDGKAIVANSAITRLLNRAPNSITGHNIETLMSRDVSGVDQDVILNLLSNKEMRYPSIKLQWGSKTLSVSFASVRDTSGLVTGTVAVFRDFTREAELERMKTDFVSIVSHELRTPMTSIRGYLDLLLMGAPGPLNEQQVRFMQVARDNTERLQELVSDLLDLSRIESGKIELDMQVVSLPDIIEDVAGSMKNQFDSKGLTLTLDIAADLPQILGDPLRISQIVTNLLSNAFKYTAQGGVTTRARQVGDFLQVDVADTGVGISPQDQQNLFTRFFRSEDPFVREQSGTGLGLNITQSLIEIHRGTIWVESEPGVGSTFSFTLPLPGTRLDAEPSVSSFSASSTPEASA